VTALGQHRADTSAGLRVEDAELHIVDEQGRELAPGQTGEIWLRGRCLMPGYFRNPKATAEVMRQRAGDDGGAWYASGDLGRVEEDGALFVVGRLKEMIIRSGFNVYPAEVEGVLMSFPAIELAAVLGRPVQGADAGNEEVIAFVVLKNGHELDRAALSMHLREHLAPYKQPQHIEVLPQLPMTGSGKVMKRELRARLADLPA
jgi:acyl-CoA synthetase (AMP-forming)/AMP-acid ligase II